jgi:methylenetetrahydrofolate dehydrogenase (NADP+)/methenyltetrahydrofolate cyclohydrolase/formyltetrahydrofolate synthetase
MKRNAAIELGIDFKHIALPLEASIDDLISMVNELNKDPSVTGILVQLPLGPHIDSTGERKVIASISPTKDVDG